MRTGTALLLSAQGLLTAASLTLAAFYPPEGSAALLLDLSNSSPHRALAWSASRDLPLISFARDGASPIVKLDGQVSALDAVKAGFLPVFAEPDLCRPNLNVEKIVS